MVIPGESAPDWTSCLLLFLIICFKIQIKLCGFQFSYSGSDGVPVHIVQLTFLKLLSATAKQTFTYHCLNSAAWLHTATYGHEHALRFMGGDGEELTHENTHYISALYDGCQVSGGGACEYDGGTQTFTPTS